MQQINEAGKIDILVDKECKQDNVELDIDDEQSNGLVNLYHEMVVYGMELN